MILDDISNFNPIYIQLHDNPDADAIASGYGLYKYFKDALKKDVVIIYSGRSQITKPNLMYMVDKLNIPLTFVTKDTLPPFNKVEEPHPILVTVDCQYGARNVTKYSCDNIAIIDHHQIEIENIERSLILPSYNACSSIVWKLLKDKKYEITDEENLGTALYYGIFTDTNQLTELNNPVDRDAIDTLPHNNRIISFLKNSNISLDEMEIAGNALRDYLYDSVNEYAISRADKCDPNILGLISDFLLQVDKVNTCVVISDLGDGIKFSVRSCVREVNAGELASYLGGNIGSGGGHIEKAGGYISKSLLEKNYPGYHGEKYFSLKLKEYFEGFDIIYAKEFEARLDAFKLYSKKNLKLGYAVMTDVVPVGTPITCRTIEGDLDLVVSEDLVVMIGVKGEVYPNRSEKFNKSNRKFSDNYSFEECVVEPVYAPTVRNRITGKTYDLTEYAHTCISTGNVTIYAQPLERGVKVFTAWDEDKYMLGKPGDFLAVRSDDLHDVYVIERVIFGITYKEIGE